MAKYLPTVDVWNPAISAALYSGQLKLQSGQWLQCGPGPKSRFISASNNHLHAKHHGGTVSATAKYLDWVQGRREIEQERRALRVGRSLGLLRDHRFATLGDDVADHYGA